MLEVLESSRALKAFWNFEKNSKNPQKSWALKFPQLNRELTCRLGDSQILFLTYKLYFLVLKRFLSLLNSHFDVEIDEILMKIQIFGKKLPNLKEMNDRFVGSKFWMLIHNGQIFEVFTRKKF